MQGYHFIKSVDLNLFKDLPNYCFQPIYRGYGLSTQRKNDKHIAKKGCGLAIPTSANTKLQVVDVGYNIFDCVAF